MYGTRAMTFAEYDTPFGLLVASDTVPDDEAVRRRTDAVVQSPCWPCLLLC